MTGLRSLQEDLLRTSAHERGVYGDLIFFYAVQRAFDDIRELRERPIDERELFLIDLVTGEGDPLPMIEQGMPGVSDPWVFYTAAKFLLQRDDTKTCLRAAIRSTESNRTDTTVLNLLSRYLAHRGEASLALELAARSLRVNPQQDDVEAFRMRVESGGPADSAPYLDTCPKKEQITFYMPVFNVERHVETAVMGLVAQNYPLHEIIVINDGSQDRSVELAERFPVTIVEHPENRGLAAARNTAFNRASTPYVGAIDTDAIPDPGYTKYIMMQFENADSGLAGVGGTLLEMNVDTPPNRWRAQHMPQTHGEHRMCSPDFLFGSNTILRREAVMSVDGYDERRRTNGEDADLCRRLRQAGFALVYTPSAAAFHARTDSVQSVLRTIWNWGFWTRVENGVYESASSILTHMGAALESTIALINGDVEGGYEDLVYIDFLFLFDSILRDIDYGVRHGSFAPREGQAMQRRLIGTLASLDGRFGGGLRSLVVRDLAGITHSPDGDACILPEEIEGQLAAFCAELEAFYQAIPEDLYRLLDR